MLQIFILLGQLLVRSDFFMESQAKNMTALLYSYACIISSMSNLCLFAGISLYHLSISEEIIWLREDMICPKLTKLQSLSTNEQSEGRLECRVSPCITSQGSQLPLSLSVFSIF